MIYFSQQCSDIGDLHKARKLKFLIKIWNPPWMEIEKCKNKSRQLQGDKNRFAEFEHLLKRKSFKLIYVDWGFR